MGQARSGCVGPGPPWRSGKLRGGLRCPPGSSPPPRPGLSWAPSLWSGVPVCWWSHGGRVGARWCVLGLICWERRRQGAEVFHKARSVSPGSWALGMGRQEPPVHTRRSHTCWDLRPAQPSIIARSKPRLLMPQPGQSRGPQSRLQRRGRWGGKRSGGTGCGAWGVAGGPELCLGRR